MGLAVTRDDFKQEDYIAFKAQLHSGLAALKRLLQREDFGIGPCTIGAEVEYYIIDHKLNALPRNQEILAQLHEPCLTVELNRFNLEYNSPPQPFADFPFRTLETDRQLGWLGPRGLDIFQVVAEDGRNMASELFRNVEGRLLPAKPLKAFMITTNPVIAKSDCLFYVVTPQGNPFF